MPREVSTIRRPPIVATVSLTLAALAVVPAALSAQELGSVPKQAPSKKAPKGEVLEWTSKAGRPYWYRIPKKPRNKPALILMLHGTGGNHGWSFWNYPIVKGSFRRDDIVVSPDGVTPGANGTFNFVQGRKDGDQLVDIIKTFRGAFDIGKVYVYGHSQGAFFCYWIAGEHPEIIDGIVAHAGNVLSVKHPKLAKEKVGIAILHGKADAVVPVSCAHRTHGIYEEQGYQKLRLEIVDGLTERSGHWPLPQQVGEMLDWLDSVTADTAPAAIAAALSELARTPPDFGIVKDCSRRGEALLRKVKGDERAGLEQRAAAIQALLAEAAGQHVAALQDEMDPKLTEYAAWVEHFRLANAVFAGQDAWDKPMKAMITRARKDEKRVQSALNLMGREWNRRAHKSATAAATKSLFAAAYPDLLANLVPKLLEEGIPGVKPAARREEAAKLAGWEDLGKEGRAAARALDGELAKAFRDEHPEWFDAK